MSVDGQAQERWRKANVSRCLKALRHSETVADRLALLRSLVRLEHGRIDLNAIGVTISSVEAMSLSRFGLGLTAGGRALHLLPLQGEDFPDGYADAERLDPASRVLYRPAVADAILLRHTSHRAYRSVTQKAAVRAALTMPGGAGMMVSMPTGAGKSLVFQIFTLVMRSQQKGACAVVITPTVALATDHERTLSVMLGLEASRALTGELSREERTGILDAFRRGEVPVLFMSPEIALASQAVLVEAAAPLTEKYDTLRARLEAVFIDEAHIVESWGRSFRPDFQRLPALIGDIRAKNPDLRTILLSATLPESARVVLRNSYSRTGAWLEVAAGTPRYEFDVLVQCFRDPAQRMDAILRLVDHVPRPTIVYTTTVADAFDLHRQLQERGFRRIALFTGETVAPGTRAEIVRAWSADAFDLVVATSAFGVGIDKPDIRTVLHACLPESPSRWYQEIGRASRDGHQGLAACLFTQNGENDDIRLAYGHAGSSWLRLPTAQRRWSELVAGALERGLLGARHRLVLDLDAGKARHNTYDFSGTDYHRAWNRNLLNLMQRAGLLDVLNLTDVSPEGVSDEKRPANWTVLLREPRLLSNPPDANIWDQLFALREHEKHVATSELADFLRVLEGTGGPCLMRRVFEAVEGDAAPDAPSCGRCPPCRARNLSPPVSSPSKGLETSWPSGAAYAPSRALLHFPEGLILIEPQDAVSAEGIARLVSRLARLGFEQFVVPESHAEGVALTLAAGPVRFGLVLGDRDWIDTPSCALADLPTAVVLSGDDHWAKLLLDRCRTATARNPDMQIAVVAQPERTIDRRRLDQTISRSAPFHEDELDRFIWSGNVQ